MTSVTSVKVDKERCSGHARCNAVAAKLFPLDDQGYVDITVKEVGPEDLAAAELGVVSCPEQALSLSTHDREPTSS